MPIKIPAKLPAFNVLSNENIFVMRDDRATNQDIRPLKIALLNLMPDKIAAEAQLLRLIGNSPLQVDVYFVKLSTHTSKNTSHAHLSSFYKTFDSIKSQKFDGMIITGAPVEKLAFEEVDYWDELKEIMAWSKTNVFSTMHICWGGQAGLYYHYNIPKYELPKKMFGVFPHTLNKTKVKLLRGYDDIFFVPHSRYTEVHADDINKDPCLEILSESEQSGVYIVAGCEGRQFFVMGHPEYDALGLKREYERDIAKGIDINIPTNYFPGDNAGKQPNVSWRSHANLLFANWLNYYVYQETPYDLELI